MYKVNLLLFIFVTLLLLNACTMNNDFKQVEKVGISYWEENQKQSDEIYIKDETEVKMFVNATNNAKELNGKRVIKTPPLLRYELITNEDIEHNYHLWLTDSGEGYIQSLIPEESLTYKLEKKSIVELTGELKKQGDFELPSIIEFEH